LNEYILYDKHLNMNISIEEVLGGSMKKTFTILVVLVFLVSGSFSLASCNDIKESLKSHRGDSYKVDRNVSFLSCNACEIIEEYTWSVMRYDHVSESEHFGMVQMPKPSPGSILIPTDMMTIELCRAAVSIYHENKTETLQALETYDLEHMVVGLPYIFWHMWASDHDLSCLRQKHSAQEMCSLGEKWCWCDVVGDCYSQAAFNTAVLRLCGFSAEEVFTLLMPMHAVTIVYVEGEWLVFDSVMAQFSKTAIYSSYHPPQVAMIYWMENDKYFINFGTPYPEAWPYQADPYSNIDPDLLVDLVEELIPLFNNATLGGQDWDIHEFIEQALPCPDIITIGVPYSVEDAEGTTSEEKVASLQNLTTMFIYNHSGGELPTQYDRSLYGLGLLSVEYPQAYANAAKYGSWTSFGARYLDTRSSIRDCRRVAGWIRLFINHKQTVSKECVAFSDFSYVRRAGSSVDQAVLAYGTVRNMKKDDTWWQPEDLYILVTEDTVGYLAVNITGAWNYINFGKGKLINDTPPEDSILVFNENQCFSEWLFND
jgi:hypothetical protein